MGGGQNEGSGNQDENQTKLHVGYLSVVVTSLQMKTSFIDGNCANKIN